MRSFAAPVASLVALALGLAGCANDLGAPAEDAAAGRTQSFTDPNAPAPSPGPDGPDGDEGTGDEPAQGPGDADDVTPVVEDEEALPSAEEDPDGDGAVLVTDEPAVAPAAANQSCSEWTDCGPHYTDPNSGFDCVSGTCTCDDSGQWADACASIDGIWSPEDCFCYVGTTPQPGILAVPPQDAVNSDDEEDVVCWWRWKDLGCDADRWVDRSYYEQVCDADGCWQDYVEDGYYEDGECYGRWIKRCSNGYEYW